MISNETLRVAIADDHPIVPVGYESGLSVANAFALMAYLTRQFPNVLVLTIISNQLSLTRLQELGQAGAHQRRALYSPIAKGK
ncbi:hypothetical protein SAMN03159355_05754 [Pseudomonas sp. NFPP10]|uniref:hypothetical protein n=2 Tax=Pseudomonas TaxID=286 RepID=UPI0008920635|nr:hypothetical protein [Pseudomonas protegens]SDA34370.1 hypothetical protein SAMN03159465_05985 [Pseudomonas sp. NFPP12]SEM72683.1 hypothetical protein SAMN03159355_05754 [Pseudomonas sp. NFPP10]SES14125.1 hypothetical protein SAMN03159354_05461 [Pseudomonas sp. NFPP19]SFK33025.1 hypothetical protein SAMN03159416_05748 [Pseudomonas sp. NFPP08]SFN68322.1 hypothetical protein SAMN03159476_06004 [Pseudomonas sp. NFPP05]SFY07294.1 hypothetical protein SAMN03159479_05755 [Pseudomonas sp. NFPP09]